jgi:L-ascorbate 6-phosphate lactonase
MKIRWLGQSGYLLSDGETEICLDPYLSDAVKRVAGRERMVPQPVAPEELKSDLVICTHNHLDHLDPDAIAQMDKRRLFCAPSDCEETLRRLGVENYLPFDCGCKTEAGAFQLEAVFADHTVPAVGLVVRHAGQTLYFSGDTYYHRRLEELRAYRPDFMFVCINGKLGNMNAQEAVRLTAIIRPKVAIPNHYGMFASNTVDPSLYASELENSFVMEFNRSYDLEEIRCSI